MTRSSNYETFNKSTVSKIENTLSVRATLVLEDVSSFVLYLESSKVSTDWTPRSCSAPM